MSNKNFRVKQGLDVAGSATIDENLTVTGNLTVNGTTTTLNTETLIVEDNIVVLNGSVTGTPSTNAGIEIERGTATNTSLLWNETSDKWQFTNNGSTYYDMVTTDTNTTYAIDASVTTGGANLNLTGSDSSSDSVKIASGVGVVVTQTDSSTINVAIGQSVATTATPTFAGLTGGNVTVGLTDNNTITTTTGDLTIASATGTINVNPGTNIDWAENSLRTNRLNFKSTNGNTSGIRVVAPNATTTASAQVGAFSSDDLDNGEFISVRASGSTTAPFAIITGKYTAGVVGASGKSITLSDNAVVYATINPGGPSATTDLTTKSYVDGLADNNTTYAIASGAVSGGANLTLSGSDSSADNVAYLGAGATTITSTDANTITITSVDTNTTYAQNASATTGGANLNLTGSDSSTDTVKIASGTGITVSQTDANTISVESTITQYTDSLARASLSGSTGISYNSSTGDISSTITQYTDSLARASISATGDIAYNSSTGVISYTATPAPVTSVNGATGVVVLTTSDIAEGTNLYFTDTRAKTAVSNGIDLAINGSNYVYVKSLRDATPIYGAMNAMYNQTGYAFQAPALNSITGNAGFDIVSSSGGAMGYSASCSVTGYTGDTQAGNNTSPAIQLRSANGTGTAPTATTTNGVIGTTNYGAYGTTDWSSTVATQGQGGGLNALHPLQIQGYSTGTVTDAVATLTPLTVTRSNPSIAGVAITGTNGFFSCTSTSVSTGNAVRITGTLTGTGSITGYASGNIYYIIGGNITTTFQLSATPGGSPIVTTAGTTTGLSFSRALITLTYATQTVAPFGLNAKVAVSGVTGVTDGTYMSVGTSTTTQVLLGTYTTTVSLGATPLLSIQNVTAAGAGYRVRGFAANTVMSSVNRISFIDHTAAAATYRADTFTFQSGTSTAQVASGNMIYGRQYISAYSSVDQTNPVADAQNLMIFGTTDIANGISIVTNGTALTRITMSTAGIYNIQFSAQLSQTSGGSANTFIWLKKNGTTVSNTAGDTQVAGNGDKIMAAWNYVVSAAAGDYYELAWAASATSAILDAIAASGVVPAIPSVILTVVPVGA